MNTFIWFSLLKLAAAYQYWDNDPQAGQSIIAGGKAYRHQFPYQISLQRSLKNLEYVHICSGALLSLTWATTTAFCVTPTEGNFKVVAGILSKNRYDLDAQTSSVRRVVVHPDYKGGLTHSDIALLHLQTRLFFTKAVQPITPTIDEDNWGAALLSSWKVQTQLYKTYSFERLYYLITYISTDKECKTSLGNRYNFSEKVLCTEKMDDALLCPGESGSPLVSNGYLVGLTCWGLIPCGVTIHTKIRYFLDFILYHVTDL